MGDMGGRVGDWEPDPEAGFPLLSVDNVRAGILVSSPFVVLPKEAKVKSPIWNSSYSAYLVDVRSRQLRWGPWADGKTRYGVYERHLNQN
jgi:hypothetical protein